MKLPWTLLAAALLLAGCKKQPATTSTPTRDAGVSASAVDAAAPAADAGSEGERELLFDFDAGPRVPWGTGTWMDGSLPPGARPQVILGDASVRPDDPGQSTRIRAAFGHKLVRLQRCYVDRLALRPGLEGVVTLSIVIGKDGGVARTQATGLGDQVLLECLQRVTHEMRFTKSSGIVMVEQPLSLVISAD